MYTKDCSSWRSSVYEDGQCSCCFMRDAWLSVVSTWLDTV